ncbi:MAG: hypothetical protein H5T70_07180, partial [Chloroflexi bacterium]|nr:hypothetical protein [Chloroflexota bacterium]
LEEGRVVIIYEQRVEREYEVPITAQLRVGHGAWVEPGDMITEGSKNPHELMAILGVEAVRNYLLVEIQKVYRSQGVVINDKHIEVIIRQMLRRVRVTGSGDSDYLPGQLVDRLEFERVNQEIIEKGGTPATAEPVVMGITRAALATDSFLSAASFQHTISVLANAAVEGKVDELRGLKESVLIGKLIPAGTGFAARMHEEPEEAPETEKAPLEFETLSDFGEDFFGPGLTSELDALDAAFLAKKRERESGRPSFSFEDLSDLESAGDEGDHNLDDEDEF